MTKSQLKDLLQADPGIPRHGATEPYWLHVKHHLASVQSDALPEQTDIVVIGSGITGTSVTKSLLQDPAQISQRITVLEARTLCSGATGRNGGNLLTYGGIIYGKLKSIYGKDLALKIVEFTIDTIEETRKEVEEYAAEESELRSVTRVHSFRDSELFEAAKQSVSQYQSDLPQYGSSYTIITGEEAAKGYDIHGVVGAILFSGYSLWPYRFIMKVWEALFKEFSSRLTIEADTPALKIEYDPSVPCHPYIIETPRGQLRASKVIHCTNGYSSHLLPGLRGLIFPCLESMTVQDLHVRRRELRCWAILQKPTHDPQSGAKTTELLYMQQNSKSGHYFIGGGYSTAAEVISANDAALNARSTAYLQSTLHEFLNTEPGSGDLVSEWTGVQGMTSDHMPVVGRLSEKQTGRSGNGEWIAAGYNGGGMCMCWRMGEVMRKMIQEKEPPQWLPEVFLLSQQRMERSLTVENSVHSASYLLPDEIPGDN
ncbi:hypothetical protein N7494_001846 [Penicillium frequentans]|uniref:FAD dependent oxidoreductase domain-containing protein n=1 Tax=Penicillium frequentans TaxID=3151616 RepID=A0AAD6D2I3_9EURO|nr:hypothetical protein N7494_001846 [Penicillium glabrum]